MDPKLLENLKNFDKENIPPEVIDKIEPYIDDPNFQPEIILKASKAAHGLCKWARAMYFFDKSYRVVVPKKQQLAQSQAIAKAADDALQNKKNELQIIIDNLNSLIEKHDAAVKEKEDLQNSVQDCTNQ